MSGAAAASTPPGLAGPLPIQSRLLSFIETLLEPVVIVIALWLLLWLFGHEHSPPWLIASVLAFALAFPGRSLLRLLPRRAVAKVLWAWTWIFGLLLTTGFATGLIREFSPTVVLNWLWFAPAAQLVVHWGLRKAAPHLLRMRGPPLRAVLVGLNEQGVALADRLAAARYTGIELMGFFDDRTGVCHASQRRHQLLGRLSDITTFTKNNSIQLIYLSFPMASHPRIRRLLDELKNTTALIYFVPDMFVTDLIQGPTDTVCGLPVISVCETPFKGHHGLLKRASDLVLAFVILLLLSPPMLAIALAVKFGSPGPVIFKQRRYGLNGEMIIVYKFR